MLGSTEAEHAKAVETLPQTYEAFGFFVDRRYWITLLVPVPLPVPMPVLFLCLPIATLDLASWVQMSSVSRGEKRFHVESSCLQLPARRNPSAIAHITHLVIG